MFGCVQPLLHCQAILSIAGQSWIANRLHKFELGGERVAMQRNAIDAVPAAHCQHRILVVPSPKASEAGEDLYWLQSSCTDST